MPEAMRYYTSGHNLAHPTITRTGEYDSLEEGLVGLHQTSETYEFAYLCNAETHDTVAYLYHGLHDKRSRGIKVNFETLLKIVRKMNENNPSSS